MGARDPHRFINELDITSIERIIDRLEKRAKDKIFTSLFDKYIAELAIPHSAHVLEIGCGTGANLRFLARNESFAGKAYGIDQSQAFIDAASRYAREEGVAEQIELCVGDIHDLDYPDNTFDVVIAHTVISHVTDPTTVLGEMARVVKSTGTMVIFDGDYASLTFAHPDHAHGRQMDEALARASFNNPFIMRDLPRILPELGLKLISSWGDLVAEIGTASYFKSFSETYAPYVAKAGFKTEEEVNEWMAMQLKAMEEGTFFAACNYYTYFVSVA